jgi:hypothetical protein
MKRRTRMTKMRGRKYQWVHEQRSRELALLLALARTSLMKLMLTGVLAFAVAVVAVAVLVAAVAVVPRTVRLPPHPLPRLAHELVESHYQNHSWYRSYVHPSPMHLNPSRENFDRAHVT